MNVEKIPKMFTLDLCTDENENRFLELTSFNHFLERTVFT